jgi:hypothetical protein
MAMKTPATPHAELTARLESEVKAVRKAGDIRQLLRVANQAMESLAQAASAPGCPAADKLAAHKAAKRLGYNAAADVWPGWDFPPPPRDASQLAAGQALARRVSDLVALLPPDGKQSGNAAWLIGAFDLALGNQAAAIDNFRAAQAHFDTAPEMALLAEGYRAIAGDSAAPPIESIMATLAASGLRHALGLCDQLGVALKIYGGRK